MVANFESDFLAVSELKDYYVEIGVKDLLFFKKGENWMMTRRRFVLHEDVDKRYDLLHNT